MVAHGLKICLASTSLGKLPIRLSSPKYSTMFNCFKEWECTKNTSSPFPHSRNKSPIDKLCREGTLTVKVTTLSFSQVSTTKSSRTGQFDISLKKHSSSEYLTQAWKSWIEEHIKVNGKVLPGNKSGNNTFVKQTPRKKSDIRLAPGRHVELTVPLEELIDHLVKESKVVAFIKGSRSAPQCGFSQRVVGILESQGVDYETVDVLDDEYNPGLRETLKNYSNWPTFPQIFVKGELVGGCDILTSMYENGELGNIT